MKALSFGFLLAFGLALLWTPLVRRAALRIGAFDPFSARKLVRLPTVPRLGGLAVAAAFYVTLAALWLGRSALTRATLAAETPVLAILIGGLPILAVGALDDLRGLRALPKLLVELAVSLGLWGCGLRVFGDTLPSCVLTVGWLVAVMNATNLIDGLDGLASGVALFALLSTAAAALVRGDLLLALLVVVLAGAVAGFLLFNFRPASIFLGDAGSLFLGYLLGTTAIWSVRKSATAVLLILPVVALGLPLLDTSLTIARRLLSGRPLTQGDSDHVHHRLLGRFGAGRAVYILYAVCAIFSALALTMLLGGRQAGRLAIVGALLCALGLAYLSGYLASGPQGLWRGLRNRQRNRALLREILALEPLLDRQRSPAEVDALLDRLGNRWGWKLALLPPGDAAPALAGRLRYPIGSSSRIYALLAVESPGAEPTPDDKTLLQLLCDLLSSWPGIRDLDPHAAP